MTGPHSGEPFRCFKCQAANVGLLVGEVAELGSTHLTQNLYFGDLALYGIVMQMSEIPFIHAGKIRISRLHYVAGKSLKQNSTALPTATSFWWVAALLPGAPVFQGVPCPPKLSGLRRPDFTNCEVKSGRRRLRSLVISVNVKRPAIHNPARLSTTPVRVRRVP